mgnify:CR=1 FL=1
MQKIIIILFFIIAIQRSYGQAFPPSPVFPVPSEHKTMFFPDIPPPPLSIFGLDGFTPPSNRRRPRSELDGYPDRMISKLHADQDSERTFWYGRSL